MLNWKTFKFWYHTVHQDKPYADIDIVALLQNQVMFLCDFDVCEYQNLGKSSADVVTALNNICICIKIILVHDVGKPESTCL